MDFKDFRTFPLKSFLLNLKMIFPEPTVFFTASILHWKPLLLSDQFKDIIISSFKCLSENKKIRFYGFVIMPNHIHLIARILKNQYTNESPIGSLLKFTAHEFKKLLIHSNSVSLADYYVAEKDRQYRFWSDSNYRIEIYSDRFFTQKLDYIHNNPASGKWHIVDDPMHYHYSSIRFYEQNINDFDFLCNYYLE